jgi:hypothetical protein
MDRQTDPEEGVPAPVGPILGGLFGLIVAYM